MPLNQYRFITSNEKKAQDALRCGFGCREGVLPEEISHPDVAIVALYKALECSQEGIVVEDTALEIEGFNIGTNIKHAFQYLNEHAADFDGRAVQWQVALAAKKGNWIHVAQAQVEGRWSGHEHSPMAYHFERFMKVYRPQDAGGSDATGCDPVFFAELPEEEKYACGPRYLAFNRLAEYLKSLEGGMGLNSVDSVEELAVKGDQGGVFSMPMERIVAWAGEYQKEWDWSEGEFKKWAYHSAWSPLRSLEKCSVVPEEKVTAAKGIRTKIGF